MVDFTLMSTSGFNTNLNARGDMVAFAENYPLEDIHMQQARKNGVELGALDPSPAVGALIATIAQMIRAKSIVEIGTGSGVGGLWAFHGAAAESTLTSIDDEREHSGAARTTFDEAGIASQRFRLITGNIIEVVGKLAEANYDLMIVRSPQDIVDVVQESFRLLKANATLIIDAALDNGRVADPTQRDFATISRRDAIKAIKEDARWNSALIPVGAGALIATKR
jgi:predicted O-methyltransferase YrrM